MYHYFAKKHAEPADENLSTIFRTGQLPYPPISLIPISPFSELRVLRVSAVCFEPLAFVASWRFILPLRFR